MMTINCTCGNSYHVEKVNVVKCPYCNHVWKLLCVHCSNNFCPCLIKDPSIFNSPILGIKIEEYEEKET